MTTVWHEYCYRWTCPHCKFVHRVVPSDNFTPSCESCGSQVELSKIVFQNGCVMMIRREAGKLGTASVEDELERSDPQE